MLAEGVAFEAISPDLRAELASGEVREKLLEALNAAPPEDSQIRQGAWAALALLSITAKDFDQAEKFLRELAAVKSDLFLDVLLELAFALGEAEQVEAACQLLSWAIERTTDPQENTILQYYLAGFLELAGWTDQAVLVARQAINAARDNPRFQLRLAWIYLHAKQYSAAETAYRELLEKWDPDHSSSEIRQVVREAKLALSHVALSQEKFEEAVEWLEQVLDEFPEDPSALNDLGYLWADRNIRLNRAYRMIRKAVEAEPNNGAYRDSLGWVLFRLGRVSEAITELQKAAELEPDPVILDHLAEALKTAGQIQEARAAWNKALEKALEQKDTEQAEKIRRKLTELP
jgi:tetratricopeptide (TPR) repeat protein